MSKTIKSEYSFADGMNHFKKNKKIKFREVNEAFLEKYKPFCSAYLNKKTRTITNRLIYIRTLFNIATKDGVVASKFYAFTGEKERILIGSGNKIGLTIEEVEKIETLKFEKDTSIWHTHKMSGLSHSILREYRFRMVKLRWSDFKSERLYYVMNKNEKLLSLKIPDKPAEILKVRK